MKKSLYHLFLVLLLALLGFKASAQVRFTNPQFQNSQTDFSVSAGNGAATPTSGSVAIAPASQPYFSVTVYRSSSSSEEGYVAIYSGVNGPTTMLTNSNTGSYSTTGRNWTSSGGIDSNFLSGYFSTATIPSGDTKLYAVFLSQLTNPPTPGAQSAPITVVPGTQPPPTGGGGSQSVCAPIGSAPLLRTNLSSRNPLQYSGGGHYYRIKWQMSTDGGSNYTTVYTSESSYDYQTPSQYNTLYNRVLYKAFLEDEYFPTYTWNEDDDFGYPELIVVNRQAPAPVPTASTRYTCGNALTIAVNSIGVVFGEYTFNWTAPAGWSINGGGSSVNNAQDNIQLTPPVGTAQGSYQVRVSSNGTCGPKSADVIVTVKVDYTPTPNPNTGSFYVGRYDGCRPHYNITMPGVSGEDGRYRYTAEITQSGGGSNSAEGTVDPNSGYVTFPVDLEGYGRQATGTIVIDGPCGRSMPVSFTGFLNGPDPSCGVPGDPTTQTVGGGIHLIDGQDAVHKRRFTSKDVIEGLNLYPNPARTSAIMTGARANAVVQVLDALGRIVLTATTDAKGTAVLSLPIGQAAGVYIVRSGGQVIRLAVE